MFASISITILVVPALLVMLLSVIVTACYTQPVPQGQNAMGLAFIFLALSAAAVAMLLAALVSFAHGTPWWLPPTWPASYLLAAAISLGVVVASLGTLFAWMERWGNWVPALSLLTGIAGPIMLSTVLLSGAWATRSQLEALALHRFASPALSLVALIGLLLGTRAAIGAWKHAEGNRERIAASEHQEAQERSRRRALTPVEALQEDFNQMSGDAPLWVFIARLPDESDSNLKALTVERARRVQNFDSQLAATLSDDHPRYRHGSLILMLELPPHARKPEWSTPLQDAIRTSARQIASDAQWLTPDAFSNPSPSDHIRAMVLAARAISEPAESKDALSELRAAIESVANKPSAAECLRVFDESLHGEP